MSALRCALTTAALVASVALMTGCSPVQPNFTDLEAPSGSNDTLPVLSDTAYANVGVSTSRYVGEHEGTSLWLAHGREEGTVCLVADPDSVHWVVTCGGGTEIKTSGGAGIFIVLADGASVPEGAAQVSENVYAR